MSIVLEQKLLDLLVDEETVKILATIDQNGAPHAVPKQSLQVDEDGRLIYLELLESSQTNKNMIASLWFNRPIAVALKGKDGASYQIKGRPQRALVAGPVFQKYYVRIREILGDVDLAAVWVIDPEQVINQNFPVRKKQEETQRPIFLHLDRLAK
ncbi:MAG TPA: hypothetical protein VN426_04480 [Syntrophomonadaceae bacterium]|nr:hypothetical protein [Syntrophomonadaceae bacterium]